MKKEGQVTETTDHPTHAMNDEMPVAVSRSNVKDRLVTHLIEMPVGTDCAPRCLASYLGIDIGDLHQLSVELSSEGVPVCWLHAHLPVFGYWYAHNAEELLAFRQALGDENARQLSGIDIALEKMRQGGLASDSTERPNPEDRRIPEPTADRRGPGDSAHVLDFEEQMSGWGAQLCPDFVPTRQELLLLAKHWYDWVDKHNYFLTLNVSLTWIRHRDYSMARIGEIVDVLGEQVLQERGILPNDDEEFLEEGYPDECH
jgi:hypothetical protein